MVTRVILTGTGTILKSACQYSLQSEGGSSMQYYQSNT